MLRIKTLGYADDTALVDEEVETMTARFPKIADKSEEKADMPVNMDKTFSQHVFKRTAIEATTDEIAAVEANYEHKFDALLSDKIKDSSRHAGPQIKMSTQIWNDQRGVCAS